MLFHLWALWGIITTMYERKGCRKRAETPFIYPRNLHGACDRTPRGHPRGPASGNAVLDGLSHGAHRKPPASAHPHPVYPAGVRMAPEEESSAGAVCLQNGAEGRGEAGAGGPIQIPGPSIPLPGTGARTGSLVSAVFGIDLRHALPAIALGVLTAGIIVSVISYGVSIFL